MNSVSVQGIQIKVEQGTASQKPLYKAVLKRIEYDSFDSIEQVEYDIQ